MNLVFASGFLVPQYLLGIEYFRGLQAHVAEGGVHAALFPEVPPTGTCEDRARVLADAILQAYPDGAVHIIAHSMGGLDSRTLIARNLHGLSDPGRIASLTTVSTPHRGSPVADLLAGPRPNGPRRLLYDAIGHAIGLLGVDTGALANLRRKRLRRYRTRRRTTRTSLSLPLCLGPPGAAADLLRPCANAPLHLRGYRSGERGRGGIGLGPIWRIS